MSCRNRFRVGTIVLCLLAACGPGRARAATVVPKSAAATAIPTAIASPSPAATRTPTPTPTAPRTPPVPTNARTVTFTPTPSRTPTRTPTAPRTPPVPTNARTVTFTPTPSRTPTRTPTAPRTPPVPTNTRTVTFTPTPTPSPAAMPASAACGAIDELIARNGGTIPTRETDWARLLSPPEHLAAALVPFSRAPEPTELHLPRLVLSRNAQRLDLSSPLRSRLLLGILPHRKTLEFISYDLATRRNEFGVIDRYDDPLKRTVRRGSAVARACAVCHRNDSPIFPDIPWSNTNRSLVVAIASVLELRKHHPEDASLGKYADEIQTAMRGGSFRDIPKNAAVISGRFLGVPLWINPSYYGKDMAITLDSSVQEYGKLVRAGAIYNRLEEAERREWMRAAIDSMLHAFVTASELPLTAKKADELTAKKVALFQRAAGVSPALTKQFSLLHHAGLSESFDPRDPEKITAEAIANAVADSRKFGAGQLRFHSSASNPENFSDEGSPPPTTAEILAWQPHYNFIGLADAEYNRLRIGIALALRTAAATFGNSGDTAFAALRGHALIRSLCTGAAAPSARQVAEAVVGATEALTKRALQLGSVVASVNTCTAPFKPVAAPEPPAGSLCLGCHNLEGQTLGHKMWLPWDPSTETPVGFASELKRIYPDGIPAIRTVLGKMRNRIQERDDPMPPPSYRLQPTADEISTMAGRVQALLEALER